MKKGKDGFYCKYIKRLIDIGCSLVALVVLSPLMLIVSILIRVNLGAPVIFTQKRIGKNEHSFTMYKFRTMTDKRDAFGELLPDIQRVTKLGEFLRSSSIDELPALFNILKGDMSIIGPRPLPMLYLPYFNSIERKRHSVRGGLSGLAQVNGRNALSWEEKFAFDIQYVEAASFDLDIRLVFYTLKKVLKRSDIGLRGVTGPEDFNIYRNRQMGESK